MLIKDHWYVACPSSKLTDKEPLAFQVGPVKYVAFRDKNNTPHILLDRCCHRSVQLSKGRIVKGCIACGYHGWQYDGSGKLVNVPALGPDQDTPEFSVPSFPTKEKDFYLWIWIAGESEIPTYEPGIRGLIPGQWLQQTNEWKTNVVPAVENQLDNAHTPFAHPGYYPGHDSDHGQVPQLRPLQSEVFSTQSTVHTFGPPRESLSEKVNDPESPGGGFGLFQLPFINYVFLTATGTRAIYHWVPLTEGSCRLEFMATTTFPDTTSQTDINVEYMEEELTILEQDRELLESSQFWQGSHKQRSIKQDLAPMLARRLIAAALAGDDLSEFDIDKTRQVVECYF